MSHFSLSLFLKNTQLSKMGCDYIECYDCLESKEDYIVHEVNIEGYATLFFCDHCLDNPNNFTQAPSEHFIAPDDAFTFLVSSYQTLEGNQLVFESFKELVAFVGDNETSIKFCIKGDERSTLTSDIEVLRARFVRKAWASEAHDEENTKYTPTPAWWAREKQAVQSQIESLTKRRKVLEEK
jgi:hypothetical protein